MKLICLAIALILPMPSMCAKKKAPQMRVVKIQKSSLTKEKEVELGKQASAEVDKQVEVVTQPEVEKWLNTIGQKLAAAPQANAYPYYFKLVNDESINAFALPGGPMFVHTGLIKAADNEAQVVGVLAHEMSHVALRHGVSQQTRAQTWQTILGVAGAAAGMAGGSMGGLLSQGVNVGGGLGVGSLLGKYSRDAERDADLNGARMAAAAGYNPIEMGRFFEKLNASVGEAGRPKGLEKWLADHPDTLARVEYVNEDIRYYPAKTYGADTGQFARIKKVVNTLPPPKPRPGANTMPIQSESRPDLPQGFSDLHTKDFAVAHPGVWKAGKADAAGPLYIIPEGGIAKMQNGGIDLIAGAMFDYYTSKSARTDLDSTTREFLKTMQQGDPNFKADASQRVELGGKSAMLTKVSTKCSLAEDPDQTVLLFTVVRPAGLWTMALAAPTSKIQDAESVFRQMVQTVKFVD